MTMKHVYIQEKPSIFDLPIKQNMQVMVIYVIYTSR